MRLGTAMGGRQVILLMVAMGVFLVGEVSGRGMRRVVRGLAENDTHNTTTADRKRRAVLTDPYQPPTVTSSHQPPLATQYQPPLATQYQPPLATQYQPPLATQYQPPQPPPDTVQVTQEYFCPQEYRGVSYQCLDLCQHPEDVWHGVSCAGDRRQQCCRVPNIPQPPATIPQPPPTITQPTHSAVVVGGGSKHLDYYELEHHLLNRILKPDSLDLLNTYTPTLKCGSKLKIKNQDCLLRARIASGTENAEACFGEWPWHVALLEMQRHKCSKPNLSEYDRTRLRCRTVHPTELYKYVCGGTLVNANHVITAAHCIKGIRQNRLKIHLGDYDLYSSARELLPDVQRSVVEATVHEGYDPLTFEDDLAILTLDKVVDLQLTPHISPVCLPSPDHEFDEHSHCNVVGWGVDPYKPNQGSKFLKAIDVTIGTEEECEDKLGESYTLGRHQLCIIGNLGADACLGDGGGAVVCPLKADADYRRHFEGSSDAQDQYFIVGIISWGSDSCGLDNSVTVISMVNPYLDWIENHITKQQYYGYGDRQSGGVRQQFGQPLAQQPLAQQPLALPPPATSACVHNQFYQRMTNFGYESLTGLPMSLDDVKCVFGEQFTTNPNYKIWYEVVHGVTDICKQDQYKQSVDVHGYEAITGVSLTLTNAKCVFGEPITSNPNYKIWYYSVHGSGASTGSQGSVTVGSCRNNPFVQKVESGGYNAIAGMSLSHEDQICVFGEAFSANPNYKIWFDTLHGGSCRGNRFQEKVEHHGYAAITGAILSLDDIVCVFGKEFAQNPNYNPWYVSVYCVLRDSMKGKRFPDACCVKQNFKGEVCCGDGRQNPPECGRSTGYGN